MTWSGPMAIQSGLGKSFKLSWNSLEKRHCYIDSFWEQSIQQNISIGYVLVEQRHRSNIPQPRLRSLRSLVSPSVIAMAFLGDNYLRVLWQCSSPFNAWIMLHACTQFIITHDIRFLKIKVYLWNFLLSKRQGEKKQSRHACMSPEWARELEKMRRHLSTSYLQKASVSHEHVSFRAVAPSTHGFIGELDAFCFSSHSFFCVIFLWNVYSILFVVPFVVALYNLALPAHQKATGYLVQKNVLALFWGQWGPAKFWPKSPPWTPTMESWGNLTDSEGLTC